MEQNRGFVLLEQLFKDALLQRNFVAKVYVDTDEQTSSEVYDQVAELHLPQLTQPRQQGEQDDGHHQDDAGQADLVLPQAA